jgi:hypothetical protein
MLQQQPHIDYERASMAIRTRALRYTLLHHYCCSLLLLLRTTAIFLHKQRGAGRSYMEALTGGPPQEETAWNTFKAPVAGAKSDGTQWSSVNLTGSEKLTGTVMCISSSGRPGSNVINVSAAVLYRSCAQYDQ